VYFKNDPIAIIHRVSDCSDALFKNKINSIEYTCTNKNIKQKVKRKYKIKHKSKNETKLNQKIKLKQNIN
jgi:hypothetical protein